MGSPLPEIPEDEFRRRLEAVAPRALPASAAAQLHAHFQELRRWNPRLSLVGPGTAAELVERHYGESLAALPLLPAGPGRLVDLGSGAGFPGLVLAAARPDLEVVLVEARERKWGFLVAACAAASLSARCLNARVGRTLPEGFPESVDTLTMRAVRPSAGLWAALAPRLAADAAILLWAGEEDPAPPAGFAARRTVALPGRARRIVELRRAPTMTAP